jgi:hypothetical protein
MRRDRADCALPLSGLAKIRTGTCSRRGLTNRAFTPSSRRYSATIRVFLRIIGSPVSMTYQRAIRSDELVPIVALGFVGRNAQAARICVSYMSGTYCGMVEEWLTA